MLATLVKNEKLMASFWQLVRFGIVGVAATLTQYFVALLFTHLGLPVLIANPAAFFVAFLVSFGGHHYWTFASDAPAARNMARFFVVALGGLAVSEGLLLLLRWRGIDYRIALIFSTLIVPPVSFVLGKLWAFAE